MKTIQMFPVPEDGRRVLHATIQIDRSGDIIRTFFRIAGTTFKKSCYVCNAKTILYGRMLFAHFAVGHFLCLRRYIQAVAFPKFIFRFRPLVNGFGERETAAAFLFCRK